MAVTTEKAADATAIRPFTIDIPEADLEDLRARIAATRWPEKETVDDALAGRAAGDDAGARALLGDRVRLAQVRGQAQLGAQLHHRDRRARHPLRPRSLQARGRAAARRLPRMARFGHRAVEDRRPAHRPHRARRERVGRLPRGDPQHAGLRVLGQADDDRLGPGAHRARLGRADEAPRLHAVRGDRRRLGRDRRRSDGRLAQPAPPELLGIHTTFAGVVPPDIDKAIQTGGPPPSDLSDDERRTYEMLAGAYEYAG